MRRGPAVPAHAARAARESDAAGQRPAGRRRSTLYWAAAIAAAAALLMFCYLRTAGTVPVLSDGAGNAMQAWDMLHGNPLLHGWWVTDVSFYTTELPQYMLVEAVAGFRPEVVHICAALTYTLLVLLAAFVARGRANGAEGAVRALLAAGIMLAPEPGAATWVLMSDPDHVGTAVPVLLLMLLLDWAGRRWYVPVAAGLLLALTIVGDPLTLVIGVVPVVAVCLARAGLALLRRRVPLRSLWFEFSLAAAAVVAVPVATTADRLVRTLGGFNTSKNPSHIVSLSVLQRNVPFTARGFLALFGADFWSVRGGLADTFAAIHLVGVALVLAAVVAAAWRMARSLWSRDPARTARADMVADLLVVAIVLNVAGYLLVFQLTNIYTAHEIGPVLSMGAALAGRQFGGPLLRARLVPALAAGLACYCAMLGFAVARQQTPPSNAALSAWLTRHDLRSGLASYWQASSVTLDSDGAIAMGAVVPNKAGRLAPRRWEEDMRLFDPRKHTADFLVTVPGGSVTPAVAVATFGPPAHVYHYEGYTIMVWHTNLLHRLGQPVSLPGAAS